MSDLFTIGKLYRSLKKIDQLVGCDIGFPQYST